MQTNIIYQAGLPDSAYDVPRVYTSFKTQSPTLLNTVKSTLSVPTRTKVIDLSHWNIVTDWAKLYQDGVRSVVLRTSFGLSGVDASFSQFWKGALNSGISVQVYHFFRSDASGASQAIHMWNLIAELKNSMGAVPKIWLDVESVDGTSNSTRINRALSFYLQLISLGTSYDNVGIYTSPGFANSYLTPTPTWINDIWSWIALWNSNPYTTMPNNWPSSRLRQRQDGIWDDHPWCQPLTGANKDIDSDWFYGTEKELQEFANFNPVINPPPAGSAIIKFNVNFRTWPVVNDCTFIKLLKAGTYVTATGDVWTGCGYDWSEIKVNEVKGWCITSALDKLA